MRISGIGQNHLRLLDNHRELLPIDILALPGRVVDPAAGREYGDTQKGDERLQRGSHTLSIAKF